MMMNFKLIPVWLILLTFTTAQAQLPNLIWSDTIVVADGNIYGKVMPKVKVTSNGEPIVVWGNQSVPNEMFVADWNGTRFNAPVNILPAGIEPAISFNSSPGIATYGDIVYITYASFPDQVGDIFIQKSTDGGTTFGDTTRVDSYSQVYTTYSPSIDVTDDGNPAIVFFKKIGIDTNTFEIVSLRSYDGGLTFIPEESCSASDPGHPTDCCQPAISTSNGNHVVWFRNNYMGYKEIYSSVSNNGGVSFDTIVRVDRSNFLMPVCPVSNPSGVLLGDTAYGIWMTLATGTPRVQLGTMSVSTGAFGFNMEIDAAQPPSVNQNYPTIDGKGDTLAIVWSDDRDTAFTNDCYFQFSVSGISGLSPTFKVNDIAIPGNQITPFVTYHNGVFHFVYSDFTNNQIVYRKATMDLASGISEYKTPEFATYPNPFNETINVTFDNIPGKVSLVIYDITGNIVLSKDNFRAVNQTLNTAGFAPGVYFISVNGVEENLGHQKIIKY
jgi:hypothetical protein